MNTAMDRDLGMTF